jgi:hypothetical protein
VNQVAELPSTMPKSPSLTTIAPGKKEKEKHPKMNKKENLVSVPRSMASLYNGKLPKI